MNSAYPANCNKVQPVGILEAASPWQFELTLCVCVCASVCTCVSVCGGYMRSHFGWSLQLSIGKALSKYLLYAKYLTGL